MNEVPQLSGYQTRHGDVLLCDSCYVALRALSNHSGFNSPFVARHGNSLRSRKSGDGLVSRRLPRLS